MGRKKIRGNGATWNGDDILSAISQVQTQLICARQRFENATDEALIDCYIYEIIALHKKYEFFLKAAKEMGLTSPVRKIG